MRALIENIEHYLRKFVFLKSWIRSKLNDLRNSWTVFNFFNIKIYFDHVFPQCQYIDLKLLFRRWFGMHMKCARTFSSFKVYNNIICTVVQTLFVLYTLLHYLVYVTLYIRIFISVFPYTFGFNHNSITNPKTTIKGTQN